MLTASSYSLSNLYFSHISVPLYRLFERTLLVFLGFPGGANGKEPACRCRRHKDAGSIPREDALEEGTGSPLQSSRLENSMDREPGGPQFRGHKESDTTEETWHTCTCIDFWGDVYWFSLIPHETGFMICT